MENNILGSSTADDVFSNSNTHAPYYIDDPLGSDVFMSTKTNHLMAPAQSSIASLPNVTTFHTLPGDSTVLISSPFESANTFQDTAKLTGKTYPLSIGSSDLEDSLLTRNIRNEGPQSVNRTTNENNSRLIGTPGDDKLRSRGRGNTLKGKAGDDKLFTNQKDKALGNGGDDILRSKGKKNTLRGGGGSDEIFANQKDDVFGNGGDDILWAGKRGNELKGGSGADEFWIANKELPEKANTILDFKVGTDFIGLNRTGEINTFQDLTLQQVGQDTRIKVGRRVIAVIRDVLPLQLSQVNFIGNLRLGEPSDLGGLRVISPLESSNVGGIYVSEAGQALQSLGQLSGIAIDNETDSIIFFSRESDNANLSPLRLDDVVTIFRAVYEGLEAPYVSFESNPSNPEGDFIVENDEITDDTYIGWSLFEADRIMKIYSLGVDNNNPEQVVTSSIPGYKNLFDPDFLDPNQNVGEIISERFELRPGEVNRRQSVDADVTLFDVSMTVITERDGQPGPSSVGALYFRDWFIDNYDAIAQEAQFTPPPETGITGNVSPLFEVERMAVIADIAQVLRNQNVFMPDWMQAYEVAPVPLSDTTPQIEVVNEDTGITIYGGATLIPGLEAISTNALSTEEFIGRLFDTARTQSLLDPFSFIDQGITYNAVVIPTDETQASGGQKLREVDLEIPIQGGQTLSLERFHHSYFPTPNSELRGWTLDLPTLKDEFITEDGFSTFQLTTPLKTLEVRFTRTTDGNRPDKDEFSSIFIGNDARIGSNTNTNLVRTPDGTELHFDEISGVLLGEVDGEFAKVYKRNRQGQVITIEGWNGSTKQASIDINYGDNGQILSAVGSNNETVNYNYNSGLLESVNRLDGTLTYDYYPNALVKDRKGSGDNFSVLFFNYDSQGNLVQESLNNGLSRTY